MKNLSRLSLVIALFSCFFYSQAQTFFPGKIIRPAGTTNLKTSSGAPSFAFPASASAITGQNILDPNGDGVVSAALTGFTGGNDVAGSEVAYKPIVPYSVEPYGDLRRGPSHMFSDFVPGVDNASYYMFYRNGPAGTEALQFRIRLGSIMSGAKGYSIMLDTDGRFGGSGATADPNYRPATTGTNGNPGFEIEIDLFTQTSGQTGIAIYNMDGVDNPGAPVWSATNWLDYSQISLAATSDNGDPDFFMDFFIPFEKLSSLGVTAATSLRAVATTVMAPQPAIGGPKSDIYGLADGSFKDPNLQYTTFINTQPPFTPTTLGLPNTNSPTSSMCTAPPVVTTVTAGTGTGQVQGSWTRSTLTGALTLADITVYKTSGGITTTLGTVTGVSTGNSWILPNLTIASGDIITAKAKGSTESMCLESEPVRATACANPSLRPAEPILSCGPMLTKGITGTNKTTGWTVWVSNMSRTQTDNDVNNAGNTGETFDPATGTSPNINWFYSSGCGGGRSMRSGSYRVWYTDANGCQSDPILVCQSGNGGTAMQSGTALIAPVVTSPATVTAGTKTISGTASAGSTVFLFVNGIQVASTTATGTISTAVTGTFSFSNLNFVSGNVIALTAEFNTGNFATSYCGSRIASKITVGCYVNTPVIAANTSGELKIGAVITGTSPDAAGTTIRLYNSGNTLLATTTVQSDGSWTTAGATYSNGFTGVAVAGLSYYATAQSGACVSSNSTTATTPAALTNTNRCGTISANLPSGNITSATTQITVAYNNATNLTVTLYEDGQPVVSQSGLTGSSSFAFNVTNRLYAGNGSTTGVLTIGVKEANQEEAICAANYFVQPNCMPPAAPTVSPSTSQNVPAGGTITYTIQSPTVGVYYTISDQTTGRELAQGVWATSTSDFTMTTTPINSPTNAVVKAIQMASSGEICVGTTSRNINILPVTIVQFSGKKSGEVHLLNWKTSLEVSAAFFEVERSGNGAQFEKIGMVTAAGRASEYSFTDAGPLMGTNYYRLKAVDIDGRYRYSQVIFLQRGSTSLVLSEVGPNPFQHSFALTLLANEPQQIGLELMDAQGKIVESKTAKLSNGANRLSWAGLGRLSRGVYLLKINTAGETLHYKLIKE
jgi:hypothetical protein